MNHQWRYFYPYYPYFHYQYPQSVSDFPEQQKELPKSYLKEDSIKHKAIYDDIKYGPILQSIEVINKKLTRLEAENKALQEEIENIKPLTIENINYKIQDLNVQDLSGNLMVGLTALSDAEELQKLLEENDSLTFNDMDTGEFEKAMKENEAMDDQNEEE